MPAFSNKTPFSLMAMDHGAGAVTAGRPAHGSGTIRRKTGNGQSPLWRARPNLQEQVSLSRYVVALPGSTIKIWGKIWGCASMVQARHVGAKELSKIMS